MNFNEVLEKLSDSTKEIEVCASGAYDMEGKKCIGVRSGSAPAGMEFHDPIIDNIVFMICGDIFTENFEIVKSIRVFKNFDRAEILSLRLRAVSWPIAGVDVIADLGVYKIQRAEILTWDDTFDSECNVKLVLKRKGS